MKVFVAQKTRESLLACRDATFAAECEALAALLQAQNPAAAQAIIRRIATDRIVRARIAARGKRGV